MGPVATWKTSRQSSHARPWRVLRYAHNGRAARFLTALICTFNVWRERGRQRKELAALVRDGFDFKDVGLTTGLAVREATRFPWQTSGYEWNVAVTERNDDAAHI
jgi:uncharacterized protein YjiS (DUF1127 family)